MRRRAHRQLKELDIDLDVARRLDSFPLAIRQMVEIARGIHSGARILILDEPTSTLSPPERRRLFALIDQLRRRGVGIVFVSHFIEDVLEISDCVTILRDGRRVETARRADVDKHHVIRRMLGASAGTVETGYEGKRRVGPPTHEPVVLAASGLAVAGAFSGLDLAVSRGECLALYGFAGAGHQEVVHALAGAIRPTAGRVLLEGAPLGPGRPHDAVRRGVALVAADRTQGLFLGGEVYKNVTVAHLRRIAGEWLTPRREIAAAAPVLAQVRCRPAEPRMLAGQLSGGNQQKVAIAKWMLGPLKVLLLDEPTRGMDVGAKHEVMRLVGELKSRGLAVILASVEPETVLAHADRIIVMSRGRVTREISDARVDKTMLMRYA
jgi:ribose transport system ATP-binding protein